MQAVLAAMRAEARRCVRNARREDRPYAVALARMMEDPETTERALRAVHLFPSHAPEEIPCET
jgi:hypothetical protein